MTSAKTQSKPKVTPEAKPATATTQVPTVAEAEDGNEAKRLEAMAQRLNSVMESLQSFSPSTELINYPLKPNQISVYDNVSLTRGNIEIDTEALAMLVSFPTTVGAVRSAYGERYNIYNLEHYIQGKRVLERLEIADHFHIKVTDLQRLLAALNPKIYKAGNRYYYDLEDLTKQIGEYRARTQKKAASAQDLNTQRLNKRKAVPLT